MDINVLNKKINSLKQMLYMLMDEKNLTDVHVVECSQKLDKLILEYQRHKNFTNLQ